jgi:hypothetical protein
MFIYSSVIYTEQNTNIFNPDIAVALGNGNTGASEIGINGTSATVTVSAANTYNYVDNSASNVDSSPGNGAHSNFTAQKYGPDSIFDTLTEQNTGGGSGSFGSSSGTSYTTVSANYMYGSVFTSPADTGGATLQNITWYGRGSFTSGNAKAVLLLHSTLAIVAVSNAGSFTTTAAERTYTFASPPTISSNTQYVLMMIFSVSTRFYYGLGNTSQGHLDTTNSYTTPTNPTDATHNNNQYRIRAAYNKPSYNYELDQEEQWTNTNYHETNEELCISIIGTNTHSLDATGGYMIVGSGTPNWGSTSGTISFWIKWDAIANRPWGQHDNMETRFEGANLVLDWGAAGSLISGTTFTSDSWYFIAIVWNEATNRLYLYVGDQNNIPTLNDQNTAWTSTVSTVGVTQNNFIASKGGLEPTDGHGEDLRYWNTDRTLLAIQSDYDIELTGSETNLRSYFKLNNNFDDIGPNNNDGSSSGSCSFSPDVPFPGLPEESIRVDVWNGSSWQNVFASLTNGWNNISVSTYLTSSTFTIRFKGSMETGDTTQDSLNIDAALLNVWTDTYDYILSVASQKGYTQNITLTLYNYSNINRLSNCTVWFHDGTQSVQIRITNGVVTQSSSANYALPASSSRYIAAYVQQSSPGTSTLSIRLEAKTQNSIIYAYLIELWVT